MASSTEKLTPWNNWPNDAGFDVHHEERSPIDLKVTGTIPSYVSGTLYRTGPGGYQVKAEDGTTWSADHWFDGFTQNHRFQIIQPTDGSSTRVIYNSRSSCDPLMETIKKTGSLKGFSFGQKRDPCMSFFRKVMSMFIPSKEPFVVENVNIGVTLSVNPPGFKDITGKSPGPKEGHASGIQALWNKTDATSFRELDPETLEPIGFATQESLNPELIGKLSAAHAKSDPVTGDVYNYNLQLGRPATYRIFRVSAATGKTDIIATITDAPGAYLHSTLITENYFILCVWSGHYAWSGAKLLWEKNILDAIGPLDPTKKALWYVVDRKHGKGVVAKYECDPFFCFHTINAWEEPSSSDPSQTDIVADLSVYKNADVIKRFYYNSIKSTSPGSLEYIGDKRENYRISLRRYRLSSITTGARGQSRDALLEHVANAENSCDLPVVNPRFITRPTRYTYGVGDRGHSTFFDCLLKYNMESGETLVWFEKGQNPGEPIFVADPQGSDEDDGVLLTVVLDGFKGKSYLLVLDARTMEEVGRASMECVVGFGFHGTYYPKSIKSSPGFDI